MIERRIADWDDAYANGPNIAGGERWPELWVRPARDFRDDMAARQRGQLDIAYGEGERNRFDLFLTESDPKGLVVFIHGGFWHRLDKNFWSHLAAGPIALGYAVAIPSYTLCPQIRIAAITREIGAAIAKAGQLIEGPIRLIGHSAGGHLATRMICTDSPLDADMRARIANTVSISGVHDLRPLMKTAMNAQLKIDDEEAHGESPALLEPIADARLCCWAGAGERAEFLRQNALLANIWTGLGATTSIVEEPDKHHFNVIDGLCDPAHALTRCLLT